MSPPRDPVIIDGGDRACVRLLLELRARISGLPAGTVIHLIASDPAAPVDLPAWCHLTGHAYLGPVPAARPTYAMRTVPVPVPDAASPRPGRHASRPSRHRRDGTGVATGRGLITCHHAGRRRDPLG